ncbi:MAG: exonuclease SbcCD subunit D [Solobacterium sp.]|jgi:exonuclease SbcD|nr:exonuclease SbcCD subunit D [Solobacterium sp.]
MRLAHLADLHLGKSVNNYSMIEDQRYILNQIVQILKEKQIDAVLIAGDVYDRPVPPAEAVSLLNDFLNQLSELNMEVFMIAGNHDSGDRLSFASDLLDHLKIHIAGTYEGTVGCVTLQDQYGPVHVYSVPFIRPSAVNRTIESETDKVGTFTEAMRYVLKDLSVEPKDRNLLIAHQFVTGAAVDENGSEQLEVGGLDQIDASVFKPFDYTALGHIHRPQNVVSEAIRYSGSPLAYSFAESNQIKAVTILDLKEKGTVEFEYAELKPMRKMEEIHGLFAEVMCETCIAEHANSYLRIVLNDEQDIPDAVTRLKVQYPYLMRLDYDNVRTRSETIVSAAEAVESKSPQELFEAFYELQNGMPMSDEQKKLAAEEIQTVFEQENS